jgi:hypothetical protein
MPITVPITNIKIAQSAILSCLFKIAAAINTIAAITKCTTNEVSSLIEVKKPLKA